MPRNQAQEPTPKMNGYVTSDRRQSPTTTPKLTDLASTAGDPTTAADSERTEKRDQKRQPGEHVGRRLTRQLISVPYRFAILALLALLLSGCSHEDAHGLMGAFIGSAAFGIGGWWGERTGIRKEASRWRDKAEERFGDALVESDGRKYWVCALKAPIETRQFVAHMLTADAPMLSISMGVTCGSCRHSWRYVVTPELKTSRVACPACGVQNLTVRSAGGEIVTESGGDLALLAQERPSSPVLTVSTGMPCQGAADSSQAREARLQALGFKPHRSMLGALLVDPGPRGCSAFCPGCGEDLTKICLDCSDTDLVRYECPCGTKSTWDFDHPVPILVEPKREGGAA